LIPRQPERLAQPASCVEQEHHQKREFSIECLRGRDDPLRVFEREEVGDRAALRAVGPLQRVLYAGMLEDRRDRRLDRAVARRGCRVRVKCDGGLVNQFYGQDFQRLSVRAEGWRVEMWRGGYRETVRTHVRHVLAKTGCERQAEIVALLTGIARPRI